MTSHRTAIAAAPVLRNPGKRSLLFRDPDGNLVNVFTPVTAGAAARPDGR